MSLMMLAIAAAALGQQASDEPGPDDVVVVATRKNPCTLKLADKVLSNSEFRERSRLWADGGQARVFLRNEASLQCRLKIVRQLAQWNVRNVEFVDPAGRPAAPERPPRLVSEPRPARSEPTGQPRAATTGASGDETIEMGTAQRQLIAGRAAHMIAKGDCAGAMKLVLDAGDLDAAAKVATICQRR